MSTEKLADELTAWIREQVSQANCAGAIFGLSGGIDSAVVGALCKRACPQECLGVMIPCFSAEIDVEHARAVASRFDIPARTVILDDVDQALLRALPADDLDPSTVTMAEANLKPRLRMLVLYYFANRLSYLVVGTGNRSEIAVGYFTKHGDGGCDILPLASLVKRQVVDLARHLGVPEEIISKPPSAGLWEGQTDEAEMGITYEELDRYVTGGDVSPEAKSRIESMMTRSAHKRAAPVVFRPSDAG